METQDLWMHKYLKYKMKFLQVGGGLRSWIRMRLLKAKVKAKVQAAIDKNHESMFKIMDEWDNILSHNNILKRNVNANANAQEYWMNNKLLLILALSLKYVAVITKTTMDIVEDFKDTYRNEYKNAVRASDIALSYEKKVDEFLKELATFFNELALKILDENSEKDVFAAEEEAVNKLLESVYKKLKEVSHNLIYLKLNEDATPVNNWKTKVLPSIQEAAEAVKTLQEAAKAVKNLQEAAEAVKNLQEAAEAKS